MGRLATEVWSRVASQNHQAVLQFSSDTHPLPSLLKGEGLFDEHEESAFENIQYPRPYWLASEGVRDALHAFIFFVVLVLFLSWLVSRCQHCNSLGR